MPGASKFGISASYSHVIIAGPNRWKYVFYLNSKNRVLDKAKWWN